jgi:enamine deaminase RidA (YjgF/YER057c/UK114 family)
MVLKIERFQPEGMNVRMSGGKPSYSHVVTVSGSGKIVYTAGQLARDVDGNCVGKGDMRAQMEQTFQNLDRCLKAADATWADVVKTNTLSPTSTSSRSAPISACATSGWRPRPARPSVSPVSPVPIS